MTRLTPAPGRVYPFDDPREGVPLPAAYYLWSAHADRVAQSARPNAGRIAAAARAHADRILVLATRTCVTH